MAIELLKNVPLFSDLSEQQLASLQSRLQPRVVEANQPVFWIGDLGSDFFVIKDGEIKLSYPDETGRDTVLAVLRDGAFFGELSLLDGGPRTATARASVKTELLCLSRESFVEFLKECPAAAIQALRVFGQRQRDTLTKLRGVKNVNDVVEQHTTAWQRIADFIATVSASQPFVLFHIAWFGSWILFNLVMGERAPDPFPFGLLTMVVSLEAIFLSIFVLISQNRSGEIDRVRADLDYQVNLKAHLEVMQLHQKVDRLESTLSKMAERQETGLAAALAEAALHSKDRRNAPGVGSTDDASPVGPLDATPRV